MSFQVDGAVTEVLHVDLYHNCLFVLYCLRNVSCKLFFFVFCFFLVVFLYPLLSSYFGWLHASDFVVVIVVVVPVVVMRVEHRERLLSEFLAGGVAE